MKPTDRLSPIQRLLKYLLLPKEISAFEATYLARINRIALAFFAIHIPVVVLLAWINGTKPWLAAVLTTGVVVGPALAYKTLGNPRHVSLTYGVAAMFMGGVLVHFGQGPVQIEMHFYFFALLAMLSIFGNPLVILVAALTVALHHLLLWAVLPASVFNYDAPIWVVFVHALFVVLESVAGCFIARSFFDNVVGLETIVRARTADLDELRLVLDNVAQGLCTIDRNGVLSPERSRAFDTWFGERPSTSPVASETVFDRFGGVSSEFAELSELCWAEVKAGVLPLALTLDQMPKELVVGGANYRVTYVGIGDGESPERFLVVVTDVTAEVSRERAERERSETLQVFERFLADRNAVSDFFDEGARIVDAIASGRHSDLVIVKRMLHTLKGNSAIFGLTSLAALCHELETYVAEEGIAPPPWEVLRLKERWDGLTGGIEHLVDRRRRVIELDPTEHSALEQAVRRGAPTKTLLRMVHAQKLEPTERRLEHFGEQIRRIAGHLEKKVDVRIESHALRVDPRHWAGFWSSFIHAVRNAVDHGLEKPRDRVTKGKDEKGLVALRTYMQAERFVVEIADDGGGINWRGVAERAGSLGLPSKTEDDLRLALFCDGVSTADQVTDVSGRGVGMGAVRSAAEALGGRLELLTEHEKGTTLRMIFPQTAMAPELHLSGRTAGAVELGATP